jgi:hypothetical protein
MGRAEPQTLLILPMSEVGSVSNSAADQASWRWRRGGGADLEMDLRMT